jgi:oligosaccharide repeat unit polymerase
VSVATIISLTICALIGLSVLWKGADVWSPGRLFAFIWILAIGLADLKLSKIQSEWSAEGWILLLIGVAAFLMGVLFVNMLNFSHPRVPIREMRQSLRKEPIRHGLLFWLTVGTFVAYILSYGLNVYIQGEVPVFSERPGASRVGFGLFGIGLIIHAAPTIMLFVTQYFVLVPGHRWRKWSLGTMFLVTLGSFFLLLYRFDLLIWAIAAGVFLYYCSSWIRPARVLIVTAAVGGLFAWIRSIRLVGHIENFLYYQAKMTYDVRYAWLTEPYMYVVTNLENFVRATGRLDHHTYGYYTFNAIMSLSGLKHWIAEHFSLVDNPYLNSTYNTYSFLWVYYRDFGVLGLAVLPFVLGAVIAWLHNELRRRPSLLHVSLYGMAVFVIVISFFHHALSLLHFVFNVLLVYGVHKMIARQESDAPDARTGELLPGGAA